MMSWACLWMLTRRVTLVVSDKQVSRCRKALMRGLAAVLCSGCVWRQTQVLKLLILR